jgi:beta-lactam-binding protein with PASTA domain
VPDVSGRQLPAARRLLAERHCTLGKIKWRKGRQGYVWSQRPEVGAVIPRGAKVKLVVERGGA